MKKAGSMVNAPLVLICSTADGWVLLCAGSLISATFVASILSIEGQVAMAVLVKSSGANRAEAEKVKGMRD
jgi:hypothetical protein